MTVSGRTWVHALPAKLAGQQRLLERLLALCESNSDIIWLMLGCSMARGEGDPFSDLDLAMGVDDEHFETGRSRVYGSIGDFEGIVDSFRHQIPGVTVPHERIFAQFADRSQIDLVVVPASQSNFPPGGVELYDPDSRLNFQASHGPVTPAMAREWAFLVCCALADLGKYLRRQSVWEALERLHEARSQLWRLVALAGDVADPSYGLTSVLDFAPDLVAAAMGETVADLDPARLLSAGRHVATFLTETSRRLPEDTRALFPDAMVRYVTADLESLQAESLRSTRAPRPARTIRQ